MITEAIGKGRWNDEKDDEKSFLLAALLPESAYRRDWEREWAQEKEDDATFCEENEGDIVNIVWFYAYLSVENVTPDGDLSEEKRWLENLGIWQICIFPFPFLFLLSLIPVSQTFVVSILKYVLFSIPKISVVGH